MPPNYVDRQALATFGHALTNAPRSLLSDLKIPHREIEAKLEPALTISAPLLLVVPLAIYQ